MLDKVFRSSWVSPAAGFTFAVVAATGILMFFHIEAPPIKGVHQWVGLVFAITGALHLAIHWRAFAAHLKRPEAIVALVIVLLICLASVFLERGHSRGPHGPRGRPGSEQPRSE